MMQTVILCGGHGTRLQEETAVKPKPMVEIGGAPVLWHIMSIYAAAGFAEFVIALGYKGELIRNYFLNYYYLRNDCTIRLKDGRVQVHSDGNEDWTVHLVDTGLQTATGGRLKRLQRFLRPQTFMMTYGDGVADIDVGELLQFHRRHGRLATITAVRPPARFGALDFDGERVVQFAEKPQMGEGWINGGFFIFEPEVFEYITGDDTILEQEPLERLAQDGQLVAYRHERFWQCMDTLRDVRLLESLWQEGHAPWKIWED